MAPRTGTALALTLVLCACGDAGSTGTDAATTTATDATTAGEATPTTPTTTAAATTTDLTTTATTGDPDVPETPPTISRGMSDDLTEFPQYLAVRKSPTELVDAAEQPRCEALLPGLVGHPFVGNKHTCVIFNPYVLDVIPDEAARRAVFQQGFEEARVMLGAEAIGERRLAVEIGVSLLDDTPERLATFLADLLHAARAARMPVLINLDAVNWWGGRPDLWNFFDPQKPGYDPANVDNVEWSGPNADAATRVFWRNWGAQIRVETPIPNLGGAKFRAAIHDALTVVGPRLRDHVDGLAPDERYLYGGTIIGTELAIGVNHYYYPAGNDVLGAPPECDPGLLQAPGCPTGEGPCAMYNRGQCPPNFVDNLSGGVAQVGYHAALDLGLISPDLPLTQGVNDEIVRNYLAFFGAELRALGLPERQLFAHTGGVFGAAGPQSLFAASTGTIVPGWSMYFEGANKPSIAGFTDSSDALKVLGWASPEWLPLDPAGADPAETWHAAIEANLNFRNNRMISVANWEGVSTNPNAVAGISAALTAPAADACVVVPRVFLGSADFGTSVGVRFSRQRGDTITYFNASTDPTQAPGGGFTTIDIANAALTGETSWSFKYASDTPIYVQLVTDGCDRDGAGQRVFSEVFPVTIHGDADPPPGPRLYSLRRGAMQLFAWDADPLAGPVRLQVARDQAFTDLLLDEDVAAFQAWARDGFASATPYHARVTLAGAPSNVVTFTH